MGIRTAFLDAVFSRRIRAVQMMKALRRRGSLHMQQLTFIGLGANAICAKSHAEAGGPFKCIRRLPNNDVEPGKSTCVSSIGSWHRESAPISVSPSCEHTKSMRFDSRANQLIALAVSAKCSGASVNANDENMVLIRGDKRVADIYFGEFMRVFAHHRFRESVKKHIAQFRSAAFNTWKP